MKLIACVSSNWGIGYKGKLLFNIPEDRRFFRRTTINNTVVMGRKTFDSLPNGPLEHRSNLVLTNTFHGKSNQYIYNSEAHVYFGDEKDIDDLINLISDIDTDSIYVIGGEQIYKKYIDRCDELLITHVKGTDNITADTFLPNPIDHGFKCVDTILDGICTVNGEERIFSIKSWKI